MKLTVYHCEIRGRELSNPQYMNVESIGEAKHILSTMPHIVGTEYYYGILDNNGIRKAIDPTGNHQYNLNQYFLRCALGLPIRREW